MGKKGKKSPKADKGAKSTEKVVDEVKTRFELQKYKENAEHFEGEYKELKRMNESLKTQYYSQRDTVGDILKTLNGNLEEQYGKVEKYETLIDGLHRRFDEAEQDAANKLADEQERGRLKVRLGAADFYELLLFPF